MNMLANISFDAAVFTSLEVMNVGVEDGVVQFSLSVFNAEHIYSQIIIKPIQWCNELFRTF
ncbi:hypothetical protein ABTN36_07830 [Acinetobacter baumannii]